MRIACRQNQIQNGVAYSDLNFETNTTYASTTPANTIRLPFFGDVNCVISWGDGTYQTVVSSVPTNIDKSYAVGGTYNISIKGKVSGLGWRTSSPSFGFANKINRVFRWGNVGLTDIQGIFRSNQYFFSCPHYIPSTVTNLSECFNGCGFYNPNFFRYPLETWETSNVTTLSNTFRGSIGFNIDISSWNTENVTSLAGTFAGANVFNRNISSWNTGNVTSMNEMFLNATAFNQPVNTWNTSNVTNFTNMFRNATNFNQPVSNWNTSNAASFNSMFLQASSFNQPVNTWNTSNITGLSSTFQSATAFNQPVNNWDVSKVTTFSNTFFSATSFNQNVGDWNLRVAGISLPGFLTSSGVNTENYSRTLIGWANRISANGGPYNITFTATGRTYHNVNYGGSPYSDAVAARAYLTTPVASGGAGWTITGDTLV